MEPDEDFAPKDKRWRYETPKKRSGFYAYGRVDRNEGFFTDKDWALDKLWTDCLAKGDTTGKGLWLFGQDYWYFQSGEEALILNRERSLDKVENCKPVFKEMVSVQRLLIGKHQFQIFTQQADGSYGIESKFFSERWLADRKDIPIGAGYSPAEWLAMKKQRLRDSNVGGKVGELKTHCVGYSSPPDAGGSQCWIASRGASQGLVTFDDEFIAGGQIINQHLSIVENTSNLDGRLFEWDREIKSAETRAVE